MTLRCGIKKLMVKAMSASKLKILEESQRMKNETEDRSYLNSLVLMVSCLLPEDDGWCSWLR